MRWQARRKLTAYGGGSSAACCSIRAWCAPRGGGELGQEQLLDGVSGGVHPA
ncbi:hypothetical protein AB0395_41655 [Streptosporangium sp. NPDC051023]|uniref:hypothetical protein n=1 Tax=Streptosporangium sp. NPDC051023 TaxID=3155410 RepID=UPI00344D5456